MTRLFWWTVIAACAAAVIAGVSWVGAYTAVAGLLGSPPPEMGNQSTAFLWDGAPQLAGHPRVWRFAFGPTRIPGAPSVVIYVSPLGRVVETEPADLEARVNALHPY